MPTGPERLRAKFSTPEAALAVLGDRYTCRKGLIRPTVAGRAETAEEKDAIDYLWLEWDYASSPYVSDDEPGYDGAIGRRRSYE